MTEKNQKVKKRSKVIIDIINNNIDIAQALEILDLLLEDINDEEIKKWVNCEINGYSKDDKVPEYRIVSVDIRGSYLVGSAYNGIKGTNQPLPLKSKYIDEFSSTDIKEGINELQHISTAEKDVENHSLVIPMNIIVAQEITLINGQILDASMHLPVYAYTNIQHVKASVPFK